MKHFVTLLPAVLLACSGSASRSPDVPPGATPEPGGTPVAGRPAPDATPAAAADIAAAKGLAAAHNAFGFDLWGRLSQRYDQNLALAPASLGLALGMTWAGARGPTGDELKRALHFQDLADPHAAGGALAGLWRAGGKPYALAVANRLFGEQTVRFEQPFLDVTSGKYGAALEEVDFIRAFEPARQRINTWVAEQTADKIKDLLPEGALDDLTRLVLVNALYFKGAWQQKFDIQRTSDLPFTTAAGPRTVPFMAARGRYLYGEAEGVQVLELPYVGGDLAMTFVLPTGDLKALEATLGPAALDAWVATLDEQKDVEVRIPRFTLKTPSMALKEALQALGMKTAFTDDADLTGMAPDDLYVKDVFHKVFVEVNEEGTEAAAASGVVVGTKSVSLHHRFIADRPFLFFVRDLRTGHVVFMGRVADPGA